MRAGPEDRVEYPIGQVLFRQEQGVLCCARVSRKGDAVAFAASNRVLVVDRSGKVVRLTPEVRGGPNSLAWSPDGREIWFGASFRDEWAIYGVDLRGHLRVVAELPLAGHLYDVAPDGRALLTIQEERGEMFAAAAGSPRRDQSLLARLVACGGAVAGRSLRGFPRDCARRRPDVSLVRAPDRWLGAGSPGGRGIHLERVGRPLSRRFPGRPDQPRTTRGRLRLVPVGPGEPRTVSTSTASTSPSRAAASPSRGQPARRPLRAGAGPPGAILGRGPRPTAAARPVSPRRASASRRPRPTAA